MEITVGQILSEIDAAADPTATISSTLVEVDTSVLDPVISGTLVEVDAAGPPDVQNAGVLVEVDTQIYGPVVSQAFVEVDSAGPPTVEIGLILIEVDADVLPAENAYYTLPAETSIQGYLVLWADDLAPGRQLATIGRVRLLDPVGVEIASFSYGQPAVGEAWAGASVPPTPGS
jgi:hypothetical protein